MFWTTAAYAMAPGPGGEAQTLSTFAPLILIFVVFYFLLIRPQQKRAKEQKAMLEALRKGDEVITNSGFTGRIVETQDKFLVVDLGDARVKMLRSAIASVTSGAPAPKERRSKREAKKAETDDTVRARSADDETEDGKDESR
jgi:preprotein translocase subunit YajC